MIIRSFNACKTRKKINKLSLQPIRPSLNKPDICNSVLPFSYIYLGTFKGTGRLYEPVSYGQASLVTKFAYNSFSRHDDWWIGIRYENGRCIFDSDESPANCSMMTHDGSF